MKKIIEEYQNSISFTRDLFQYAIPGLMFLSLLYYLFPINHNTWIKTEIVVFHPINSSFIVVTIIIIFAYFIGMFANSISYEYFSLLESFIKILKINKSYFEIKEHRLSIAKKIFPKTETQFSKKLEITIIKDYLFNQVATYNQGLYKNRVERYNNITMYYRTISSLSLFIFLLSFLFNTPFNLLTIRIVSGISIVFIFYLWMVFEKSLITMIYTISIIVDNNLNNEKNATQSSRRLI
jgi:hypothetical protein